MNLKKALFTIAFFNFTIALILSAVSFWGCMELSFAIAPRGVIVDVHTDPVTIIKTPDPTTDATKLAELFSMFQFILPMIINTLALFFTASMFYRLKLKQPLEALTKGTSRIIDNDLDFTITADSQDELGQLCIAFETMRKALLDSNHELWRQADERKRLNAAFSHNLRNPVTVLKGSAKLAKQGLLNDALDSEQLSAHLSLIENYTSRIERYIETMSSIQKLEEIPLVKETIPWNGIISDLKNMIHFIGLDSPKQIQFQAPVYSASVLADKSILFQIAENLISNALRFAVQHIDICCTLREDSLVLSVTDDGCGFPAALLKNNIQPFQKGNEDPEHFGIGLYTSKLLAKRHGGNITCQNNEVGATVSVTIKII